MSEKKEASLKGVLETAYLLSQKGMKEKLIDGLNTPLEECLSDDEVNEFWEHNER